MFKSLKRTNDKLNSPIDSFTDFNEAELKNIVANPSVIPKTATFLLKW